jgi:hypothetical protein
VPGKLMWWHDAIIDEMLENPGLTKKEIAFKLRATPTFIYMITNSDLFAARWEQRRGERTRTIEAGLTDKLNRTVNSTLDRILEQIEDQGRQIPLGQLESLADKTLGRLGYGPKPVARTDPSVVNVHAPAGAVQVILPATHEELSDARRLIAQNEARLASEPERLGALASGARLSVESSRAAGGLEAELVEENHEDGTTSANSEGDSP